MRITKIEIKNYRLLKDVILNVEQDLSLVIGKNNTGKTSILELLNKFLNYEHPRFSFNDFNLEYRNELLNYLQNLALISEASVKNLLIGIDLKLYILIENEDRLENIKTLIMDLDVANNYVILAFRYSISKKELELLKQEISNIKEDTEEYLAQNYHKKYQAQIFSLRSDQNGKCITNDTILDLDIFDSDNYTVDFAKKTYNDIKKIIQFKYIHAGRGVTNNDKSRLAKQTNELYKVISKNISNMDNNNNSLKNAFKDLRDKLKDSDSKLSSSYETIFTLILEKLNMFGNPSNIKISSILADEYTDGIKTKIEYQTETEQYLPEHHNGLGYMNLMNIVFQIEIFTRAFQMLDAKSNLYVADINLLFIEEPEAHTHPQMQSIFIKNIKQLLQSIKKETLRKINDQAVLQTIITTHSAHIVSDCDFDDIKYLKKSCLGIDIKDLKILEKKYPNNKDAYKFLKKYLTIGLSSIFFADKAIFVEGATERILLPIMMQKIDQESTDQKIALRSQNIAIIDIGGRYFNIFEPFIKFLGIKSLIITDLDTSIATEEDNSEEKIKSQICATSTNGAYTTNPTIKNFFNKSELLAQELKETIDSAKVKDNICRIAYQVAEDDTSTVRLDRYCGRTFEDAFINLNYNFIDKNIDKFKDSLYITKIQNFTKNSTINERSMFDCFSKCVKSNGKVDFAIDIIINTPQDNEPDSTWRIPKYIKDGLEWLQIEEL